MKVGEVRKFEIDAKEKPKCSLPSKDNIIEIKIKKLQENENDYQFIMQQRRVIDPPSYIMCEAGHTQNMEVAETALDCGIGKILMKLCLNEEEIHNVANNVHNKAVKKVEAYAQANFPKAKELEKWVKDTCQKLLHLTMVAKPPSKAYVYFNSAIEADYSLMFIALCVLATILLNSRLHQKRFS